MAIAQYCSKTDTLRLHSLTSYEIKSSEEKTEEQGSYTEVTAAIATTQTRLVGLQAVSLDSVVLQVWNSEEFYNAAVKGAASLSALSNRTAELTGEAVPAIATPVRTDYSAEKQCVFLPFDQFESMP